MQADRIIYTSNTGFTERYANLLARETGLPCLRLEEADKGGRVLYLGWLRAGSIVGLRRARRLFQVTGCCAVGLGDRDGPGDLAKQLPDGRMFYLRGGYDHSRLTGLNRSMMNLMIRVMKKRPEDDAAARTIVNAARDGLDCVSMENLAPVLAWLRS